MILSRNGSKRRFAHRVIPHFPAHKLFIEPFFGAGGIFFSKPKAKYNILNDADSEVYNLFKVVTERKEELVDLWRITPMDQRLFKEWRYGPLPECPLMRAVRFLLLSNCSYLGTSDTFRIGVNKEHRIVMDRIDATHKMLAGCRITGEDFRAMLKNISVSQNVRQAAFIYCDPPYLDTAQKYGQPTFTEQDSIDLFDALEARGMKWAMSEFDHPFILQQAADRGLNVIDLGGRYNKGKPRMEILVTNYESPVKTLFKSN